MKKLAFVLVMFLVGCSDGGSEDPTIQLYRVIVDLNIHTTHKTTDFGRVVYTDSQDIVLVDKSGLTLDAAYDIKNQYPSTPEIITEVRPEPWNLTIITKKTYKITMSTN